MKRNNLQLVPTPQRTVYQNRAASGATIGRVGAACCLLLVGCGQGSQTAGPAQITEEVINGRNAGPTDYPSAVYIDQDHERCTAVKVATRLFLTAEHCVGDRSKLSDEFSAGAPLHLTAKHVNPTQPAVVGNIVRTTPNPIWFTDTKQGTGPSTLPDLAVIEIDRDTPDIPIAIVDPTPVEARDPLAITGYGCDMYSAASHTGGGTLRLGSQKAVAAPATGDRVDAMGNYVLMLGPGHDKTLPAACPGIREDRYSARARTGS